MANSGEAKQPGSTAAAPAPDSDGPDGTGPHSLRSPPTLSGDSAPPTPRSTLPEKPPAEIPASGTISAAPGAPPPAADPDTLISGPRPAEREELDTGDRFRLLEDRIDELEARIRRLERPLLEGTQTRAQPWWIWLIFLLGLAVTWRLLEALR